MHFTHLTTLLLATISITTTATAIPNPAPAAVPDANPDPALDPRATQLRWDAVRDKKTCRSDWSGVCYEHCVTEGTSTARRCQRNTITSAIDGSGCGLFKSRCKCTCVRP
ncbi:hypothetical protein IAQ61_010629 [Plenodomus lingam]|uniref:uncharacterized protein n=1 Tax=Leptosphaeria maculans TaxID=5022 RepID=UPI00331EDBF0|nr:hypothetical protein IAQ61_010629 [Plenodomus lingam]